jgi:uncharacterized protein YukE
MGVYIMDYELIVNYANINDVISDLNDLKNRIQKYSNKSYTMQQSSGSAAQAMLSASEAFTKVAKKLEEYIDDTIKDVNYASNTFASTDNKLAEKFK